MTLFCNRGAILETMAVAQASTQLRRRTRDVNYNIKIYNNSLTVHPMMSISGYHRTCITYITHSGMQGCRPEVAEWPQRHGQPIRLDSSATQSFAAPSLKTFQEFDFCLKSGG
jgi:hypothetical protein